MTAGKRRGALIAGLVFIGIGLVFLLEGPAWRVVARYWPVLLIIIGLNKLYGYFTWQQEVPPVPDNTRKE